MSGKIINSVTISCRREQKQHCDQTDQNLSAMLIPVFSSSMGSPFIFSENFLFSYSARSFSTLASFTHATTNTLAAFPSSSIDGNVGAIRIFESLDPYRMDK